MLLHILDGACSTFSASILMKETLELKLEGTVRLLRLLLLELSQDCASGWNWGDFVWTCIMPIPRHSDVPLAELERTNDVPLVKLEGTKDVSLEGTTSLCFRMKLRGRFKYRTFLLNSIPHHCLWSSIPLSPYAQWKYRPNRPKKLLINHGSERDHQSVVSLPHSSNLQCIM